MTMTFVPGYQTGITVNLVDVGIYGKVVGLDLGKNTPTKALFGKQFARAVSGQKNGSFSAQGHVTVEGPLAALVTAYNLETPVAFEIAVGEDGGASEAGQFTGNCIIGQLSISADAEGEWDWSINAVTDDTVTYVAP